MTFFNTVAGTLTLEIMTGHRSGITVTFAGRDHVNRGNIVKNGEVQFLTNFITLNGSCKFSDEFFRFTAGFGSTLNSRCSSFFLTFAVDISDMTTF